LKQFVLYKAINKGDLKKVTCKKLFLEENKNAGENPKICQYLIIIFRFI